METSSELKTSHLFSNNCEYDTRKIEISLSHFDQNSWIYETVLAANIKHSNKPKFVNRFFIHLHQVLGKRDFWFLKKVVLTKNRVKQVK